GGKHVEITVQQSNMRPIIVNDAAIRPQGCAERCLRIVLAYLDFGHRSGFFINQLLRDEEQNVLFRADIHVETCQVERTGSGNVGNRCVVKTVLEKKSGCDVDYFAAPLSDQILVLDRGRNFLAHGASAGGGLIRSYRHARQLCEITSIRIISMYGAFQSREPILAEPREIIAMACYASDPAIEIGVPRAHLAATERDGSGHVF